MFFFSLLQRFFWLIHFFFFYDLNFLDQVLKPDLGGHVEAVRSKF